MLIGAVPTGDAKPLQVAIFAARRSETGLVAMQKVEGSNPFSRFASIPLRFGRLAFPGENQTTPTYPLHFGHYFPK